MDLKFLLVQIMVSRIPSVLTYDHGGGGTNCHLYGGNGSENFVRADEIIRVADDHLVYKIMGPKVPPKASEEFHIIPFTKIIRITTKFDPT